MGLISFEFPFLTGSAGIVDKSIISHGGERGKQERFAKFTRSVVKQTNGVKNFLGKK